MKRKKNSQTDRSAIARRQIVGAAVGGTPGAAGTAQNIDPSERSLGRQRLVDASTGATECREAARVDLSADHV
jgi:hypothetical protein